MSKNLICTQAISQKDIIQALMLRKKILVKELKHSVYRKEPDRYDKYARIYVVKDNKKIVGTVRVRKDKDVFRIQKVAIDKNYRMKGVGSTLLSRVLDDYSKLYVMSTKENVEFYQRFGFIKIGEEVKSKKHSYYRMQNY